MEVLIGVIAFIVGGGAGFGLAQLAKPKETLVVEDKTSQTQQEVIKELTNLDLILPLCNPNKQTEEVTIWSSQDQALMCRYLACLQFSRGIDSKTGGKECEAISNVLNKKSILSSCNEFKDDEKIKQCIEFFDRRL